MLQIKENPGAAPVDEMRKLFEEGIRNTPVLAKSTSLGVMEVNGKFSHYMDADTDTMWIGFALGYRAAERAPSKGQQARTSAIVSDEEIQQVMVEHGQVHGHQPAPLGAIGKLLDVAMDLAVANGANSISMPDEYVEIAAWLCGETLDLERQPKVAGSHSIEGVIRFMRSNPAEQACVCCPPGEGHIFNRRVDWDAWDTGRAEHFGRGPEVLLARHATDLNENEGKRVRVTVEVLDGDAEQACTYSFRAECPEDVSRFVRACALAGIGLRIQSGQLLDPQCPDTNFQLDTEASLGRLQDILRQIPDGHVMLQTLRACPLDQNSLERDWSIA